MSDLNHAAPQKAFRRDSGRYDRDIQLESESRSSRRWRLVAPFQRRR